MKSHEVVWKIKDDNNYNEWLTPFIGEPYKVFQKKMFGYATEGFLKNRKI